MAGLALLASSVNVSSQYLGNNENEMILNVCTTAAVGGESGAGRGWVDCVRLCLGPLKEAAHVKELAMKSAAWKRGLCPDVVYLSRTI